MPAHAVPPAGPALAAAGPPPTRLPDAVLAAALDAAADGMAVLDDEGHCLHLNPAGCRILGIDGDPAGRRLDLAQRDVEPRSAAVATVGGPLTVVTFRDVAHARRQQRRLGAFAAAAAEVAYAGSLRHTLDAICAEVVAAAGLAGAQTLLVEASGLRMRVHGAAPVELWPEDFALRLEEARRRGAHLASLEAFRSGRPAVQRGRRAEMLADPAWEPLHDQLSSFAWDTFVALPLVVHGRALGALNAYYPPGRDPDADEIAFLTAMADQAAVAVEFARLLAETRGAAALDERHRLARELHDSACQQLFSMTLHIRAAQLTIGRDEPAAAVLQTLDQLAHAALDDLRALVFELHPTLLHTEGLVAAVREQARSVTKRTGLPVTVDGPDERLPVGGDAELDAYRIVQEALHNCVKHAGASTARVRVAADPGDPRTLVLEVADDGRGFDPATATAGLGLVSMRERSERLGAELTVSGGPGGTTVRVVAPRVLGRPREDGP